MGAQRKSLIREELRVVQYHNGTMIYYKAWLKLCARSSYLDECVSLPPLLCKEGIHVLISR